MDKILVNIEPGSGILGTYKIQSYKLESAFAEFIDNSTQSFFSHREELKAFGQTKCKIIIEIYPDYIKITDNAFGMEDAEFRRALKLNSPPPDTSGRSEKGMGLKTSATCLGSWWSVESTQYGSTKKYRCCIDVDVVAAESPESVEATVEECSRNDHYTVIEIKRLNKKISENKIKKLITTLSEMYSKDIKNTDLVLIINKTLVKYVEPEIRIDASTGSEYKDFFSRSFVLDGETYSFEGWVGIRSVGDTEFSGFNLFRKGRAIKMHYRPTSLLGKANSFPYQRIIGEISLLGDNWEPSYTKDELMWEGELEERFIAELKTVASRLITISTTLRKEDKPVSKEKRREITANLGRSFQTNDNEGIQVAPQDRTGVGSSSAEATAPSTSAAPVKKADEEVPDELDKVSITIQGSTYTFWVTLKNNNYDPGIQLNKRPENNEFNLCINYGLPYYGENTKNKRELELIQKNAITIATAVVSAQKSGDKEAYRVLDIVNSILRCSK